MGRLEHAQPDASSHNSFCEPKSSRIEPHPRQSNSCESKWSGIELPLEPQPLFRTHLEPNNDAELDSPELNKTKDDSERYTLSLDKTQRRPEEKNLKNVVSPLATHRSGSLTGSI